MPKYIKTKSNYVLKKEHRRTPDGRIFERDYMTITDKDGFSPTNQTDYGQYKFRFVVNEGLNLQKKHQRGSWLENESSCIEGHSEYWTEGCLPAFISPETKIELNPEYDSLKDFAYYGSAVELVRASLTDIILRFPAELYFTSNTTKPKSWGIDETRYYVENDYGINIHTKTIFNDLEGENPIRYFAHGVKEDYVVITPSGDVKAITSWTVSTAVTGTCVLDESLYKICDVSIGYDGGSLNMEVWNLEPGEIGIVSKSDKNGYRIRPNSVIIEDFFKSLDGFESLMLNKKSIPIYTMNLKTPFTTDDGYFYKKEDYTWPNNHEWNPSLSSYAYDLYVQRLISLATYHDEYDSDNIWRSMTHEAIKNLDWTFTKETSDDIEEYETIDTTRIAPVLKVWGRQYDDVKRYIDNIKYITNLSYDKKNNLPDYFVTDALETGGWDVTTLNTSTDNDIITDILYSGHKTGYTVSEVSVETMRRLRLNSPYLLRMKGTVNGIKCLLALFGIDATITEYVRTISVADLKKYTYTEIADKNLLKLSLQSEEPPEDELTGLPLKEAFKQYDASGNVTMSYVVPWYDGTKEYDGNTYFQMNGGWGLTDKIVPRVGSQGSTINLTNVWSETVSNMKFAGTLQEMTDMGLLIVKSGDICYVDNISDFSLTSSTQYYIPKPGTENVDTVENSSHYFVLENDKYCSGLGWVVTGYTAEDSPTGGTYGWRSITNSELANVSTQAAKMVHYYESVVDTNVGNNPHDGKGVYDGGEEYFERLRRPFVPAINSGEYDGFSEEDIVSLSGVSFGIGDSSSRSSKTKYYSGDTEESYSVLNDKKLRITFNCPTGVDSNKFKNFINSKVLMYVEQMIPSTTITEYRFD